MKEIMEVSWGSTYTKTKHRLSGITWINQFKRLSSCHWEHESDPRGSQREQMIDVL